MASSKALVLLALAFALILLISSRVSAREFTETIPEISVDHQNGHKHGHYDHSHGGRGSGHGHGHEGGHRKPGHGHDEGRHHGRPGHDRHHPGVGAADEEQEIEN